MIVELIRNNIQKALTDLGLPEVDFALEHPGELSHGDYSTNVALVLANQAKTNPRALAEKIVATLRQAQGEFPEIQEIQTAGPGFINFHLSRKFFTDATTGILQNSGIWGQNSTSAGKKIMVEYTDPNPFKPFHIGHLMTNVIGESIARLGEWNGAHVIRANYQGDVGLHVAKTIYRLLQTGKPEETLPASAQAQYIGMRYSEGSNLYDEDENAKKEIDAINKKIYEKSDPGINALYDWGREVTLAAFEEIYALLGTKFVHYFFESEMAPIGVDIVKKNVGSVFSESDGAIVFKAEEHDPKLHTRVFITSQGLPTYETKELGLTETKFEKESNLARSIVITANEQAEYMKVVQKAIELMKPDIAVRMRHITHGMMRLTTGKMGSRKGNVVTGEALLADAQNMISEKIAEREFADDEKKEIAEIVGVAALKYSILRSGIGSDIVYDAEKSISFEGDSGPYLQYSATRAASVLKKAQAEGLASNTTHAPEEIFTLEKYLYRFPEVVARAQEEYEPHHIVTYLTALAGEFNAFYAQHPIVGKDDQYSPYKIALTEAFIATMKNGLYLLGIKTPEKM